MLKSYTMFYFLNTMDESLSPIHAYMEMSEMPRKKYLMTCLCDPKYQLPNAQKQVKTLVCNASIQHSTMYQDVYPLHMGHTSDLLSVALFTLLSVSCSTYIGGNKMEHNTIIVSCSS